MPPPVSLEDRSARRPFGQVAARTQKAPDVAGDMVVVLDKPMTECGSAALEAANRAPSGLPPFEEACLAP